MIAPLWRSQCGTRDCIACPGEGSQARNPSRSSERPHTVGRYAFRESHQHWCERLDPGVVEGNDDLCSTTSDRSARSSGNTGMPTRRPAEAHSFEQRFELSDRTPWHSRDSGGVQRDTILQPFSALQLLEGLCEPAREKEGSRYIMPASSRALRHARCRSVVPVMTLRTS